MAAGPFRTLDLSAFYTQAFTNEWRRKPWSQMPRGNQTLHGVPFQIGGKVELTGLEAARRGDFKPPQVTGIRVEQKAERIILLHGAAHGHKDGTPMAKLILHYATGETQSFRLAYGVHGRNWVRHGPERRTDLDDPGSVLAWSGASEDSETSLRVYQTTFRNPHPDRLIQSLELHSLLGKPSPLVFAITLDSRDSGPGPGEEAGRKSAAQANAFPDSTYVQELVLQVEAAESGRPVTNATVSLSVVNDQASFSFGKALVDQQGQVRFQYPPLETTELRLLVQAPGREPRLLTTSRKDQDGLKNQLKTLLAQGAEAGGIVRSRSGPPIAGAEVLIYTLSQTASNEITQMGLDVVMTDESGQWSSTCLPAGFTNVHFRLSHPEYKIAEYVLEGGGMTNRMQVSRAALLANQAVLAMDPRIHLAGQVLDSRGRALPDAELFYRGPDRPRQRLRTDREGRFSFFINEGGSATLAFMADGFAAQVHPLELAPGIKPLKVVLRKGVPLKGQVMDESGKAIEGAVVSLESWNTTRLVQWRTQTDSKGNFTWTNAPAGGFTFYVSKDDYNSRTVGAAAPSGRELKVILRKPFRISGQVLDADTREPIQAFDITRGQELFAGEPTRWERGNAYRFKHGRFTINANDLSGTPVRLLAEAPGYLPLATAPITTTGVYTNDMLLKKGKGLLGEVVLPSGKPASKAIVVLAAEGEEIHLDGQSEFRRGYGNGISTYTRGDGGFGFNPRLSGQTVVASHPLGFGKMKAEEVAKTGKVNLQPWGKISGTLIQTGRPPANVFLALHNLEHEFAPEGEAPFHLFMRTRPDNKGRFSFDKVPPGQWKLSLYYRLHENTGGPPGLSHGFPVSARAGETNTVAFNLSGRTLVGKVQVNEGVDWLRDAHQLVLHVTGTPDFTATSGVGANSSLEQTRAGKRAKKERAFWTSKQGEALRLTERAYLLLFDTNGTFHIDNVPPGNYELRIAPTDPGAERYPNEPIGVLTKKVVVREGKTEEPIDLGTLTLQVQPSSRVGGLAPALNLKSSDGRMLQVADFKGKILVVEFWSLWSETRAFNLEAIRSLMETGEMKNKLAVVSINLDDDSTALEAYLRSSQIPWLTAQLPARQRAETLAAWGLTANGGVMVIGPDGRIASRPLQSDYIRYAVRKLLPGRN